MEFKDAYKALRQGYKIKMPEWKGYWKWEDDSIKMYCKDGSVLDIRETKDVNYTFQFIIRDDWIVENDDPEEFEGKLNVNTLTFGEALRQLKKGDVLARLSWKDELRVTVNNLIPKIMYHKKFNDGWMLCGPYAVTDEDVFAEDWYIVSECMYT